MAPNGTLKRKGSKDVPKRYDEDVASISKTNGLEVNSDFDCNFISLDVC